MKPKEILDRATEKAGEVMSTASDRVKDSGKEAGYLIICAPARVILSAMAVFSPGPENGEACLNQLSQYPSRHIRTQDFANAMGRNAITPDRLKAAA